MTYQLYPLTPTTTIDDPAGRQGSPVIASLEDGGAIVVWSEQRGDDPYYGYDIVAQRYDATGAETGARQVIYSGPDDAYDTAPLVTGLEGGGYAIAWRDDANRDMRVASYDATGALVSDVTLDLPDHGVLDDTRYAEVFASEAGYGRSALTALEGGGYALVWDAYYSGILAQYNGASTVYAATFDEAGQLVNAPFTVAPWIGNPSYTVAPLNHAFDAVTLAGGNFLVVTRVGNSTDGNDSGFASIGLQIYGADGSLVTPLFLASALPDEELGYPAAAALADGSFVVAWTGSDDTYWRHFAADGTPLSGDVSLGRLSDTPNLIGLADGGFLLTFNSVSGYNPSYTTYAQRYDANGDALGDIQTIAANGDAGQTYYTSAPDFVTLGDGTMLAIWGSWDSWTDAASNVMIRQYLGEQFGTTGDDELTSTGGPTAFYMYDGDDRVTGSTGGDVIFGDAGDDRLDGQAGDDRVEGGDGADFILGRDGNDQLDGGAGADTIWAGPGDDTIVAGDGDDEIGGGDGNDVLILGVASDAVTVRGPDDAVVISSAEGADTVSAVETFQFSDTTLDLASLLLMRNLDLVGTAGDDTLIGDYGDDRLRGLAGDDQLFGGEGADTLSSGLGHDTLWGDGGDDTLRVENDGVVSIPGTVINPPTSPFALGDGWSRMATSDIELSETRPHQTLLVTGTGGEMESFSFTASAGQTWIFDIDGASFDTYLELYNETGVQISYDDDSATTEGAGGSTTSRDSLLSYTFTEDGTYVISVRAYGQSDVAAGSTFTLNVSVDEAGNPLEIFTGTGELHGGTGDDLLQGGAGSDRLLGEDGNDTLEGGDGRDTISGGTGNDTIFGGASELDRGDLIYAGDGNDSADGGWGNDQIVGDAGDDTLSGGYGADTVIGNDGNDQLDGGVNADILYGGDGNDWLSGGFANDRYVGGAGADRFFHTGTAQFATDWIQDYTAADGDQLQFGGPASLSQFQVNLADTGAGDATVDEAFVVYRPTGQILWALVDGAGQDSINILIGGVEYDLLA